jgi:uncharacterized protein YjiK
MTIKKSIAVFAVAVSLISCDLKSKPIHLRKIADIPEASGVCYSKKRDSLFVVGDEGRVYELSKDGKVLNKIYLPKHDFEGIACDDKENRLYLAVEGKDHIIILSQNSLKKRSKIKIKREYKGKLILKKNWKKNGLEGITLIKNSIALTNQSKKFLPKKDPSVILLIEKNGDKKREIKSLIDLRIKDLAGLDYYNGYLYVVSDHEDLLIKYDLKKQKIVSKIKLPPFAQEGVAIDSEENIYFADDNGHIYKSKLPF